MKKLNADKSVNFSMPILRAELHSPDDGYGSDLCRLNCLYKFLYVAAVGIAPGININANDKSDKPNQKQ